MSIMTFLIIDISMVLLTEDLTRMLCSQPWVMTTVSLSALTHLDIGQHLHELGFSGRHRHARVEHEPAVFLESSASVTSQECSSVARLGLPSA